MKWASFSTKPPPEVGEEKIREFERELGNLGKVLGKVVSKLTEVGFPLFNPSEKPEMIDDQGRLNNEYLLYWYYLNFTPSIGMEILRVNQLRYLNRTLKNIGSSYYDNRVLEFSFYCRHFLEVSASYVYAAEDLVNLSEPLRKSKIHPKSMSLDEMSKYKFFEYGGGHLDLIVPVVNKIGVYNCPMTVNLEDISLFRSNNPLKPKKGQLGYNLLPKGIMNKLQKFEKKIPNIRPTYDLLSEFLHPNSFIFSTSVSDSGNPFDQFPVTTTPDEDDGRETLIEFFVRTDMHITLKTILNEVLKFDRLLEDAAIQWKRRVKGIVNKLLGPLHYHEFLASSPYSNDKCLCGSGKLIRQCCAKTSKGDIKKLKKYKKT
jgi:hypothetical protein